MPEESGLAPESTGIPTPSPYRVQYTEASRVRIFLEGCCPLEILQKGLTMQKLLSLLGVLLLPLLFGSSAAAQDPYTAPNDTWISISGTVESVDADEFTLDFSQNGHFGEGLITVEMDDDDRDADGYKLLPGDTVTVYGIIDDDLFDTRTIEASSVYVANLGTFFEASAMDEEDAFVTLTVPPVVSAAVVQGTVSEVEDEEFRIDTGSRQVRVEVEEMPYNPLDDMGYQKIEVGDEVAVSGYLDYDFLEGRELVATSVTTLE